MMEGQKEVPQNYKDQNYGSGLQMKKPVRKGKYIRLIFILTYLDFSLIVLVIGWQ